MSLSKKFAAAWCACLLWLWAGSAIAVPVTFYDSYAGYYDYVVTGGSLRTSTTNQCLVTNTNSAALSGVPATATVANAFLYWAGSGATPDLTVTFEGNTIVADRSFTETASGRSWFAGFEDVTSIVQSKFGGPNGTYTFADLTVDTGGTHCTVATVLSGWGLVVIYEDPVNEPLRVINLFDGLQNFWGTSITLIPNNFVIPGGTIDGRFGVLTWEGDIPNLGGRNGLFEELRTNGNTLINALNPLQNQYNSTVSDVGVGSTNNLGVDFDVYDISPYLTAGDTSLSTFYSSGQDRVLLTLEIVSVTNTPVVDLAINKTHTGNFTAGQQGQYTITVNNNGPIDETNTITVTDTLPAGLSYVSATSVDVNWSCGAVGSVVTCTHPGPLANGASLSPITLTVNVSAAAAPSVNNTATVSSATFDNVSANDSSTDPTTVLVPDVTTSTKTVLDLNGGEADVGDTLRYTITITESGGAAVNGVSVTDTIDALLTGFNVVSVPVGATDSSTPGTGPLNVTGINVPASGSVSIVFDAVIAGAASPGDLINNTAVITNPVTAATTNAVASTVTVSPSLIPATGIKNLYPYFNEAPAPNTDTLQRVVPTTDSRSPWLNGGGASTTLTMTPSTQANLELGAGNIQIPMCIRRDNPAGAGRNVTLALDYVATGPGGSTGVIGSDVQTGILGGAGWQVFIFNVNLAATTILNPNTAIRMTVTNNTAAAGDRIRLRNLNSCGITARIELNANTVINVDSIDVYDANYPGGSIQASYIPGANVSIRSVVSDPFGSADITGANIEIINPLGVTVQAFTPMTSVATTPSTRTYEFLYTVPAAGPQGNWTTRVVANEGTEGTVTDLGVNTFVVGLPNISVLKSALTLSDPVNNATNPKAIPGALVQYQLLVTNSGLGPTDSNSVVISDNFGSNLQFAFGSPLNPVTFVNGAVSSGLTFTFTNLADNTDDVDFSNDGGSTFITPLVDGAGYDITSPPINYIRINPQGAFNASSGSGDPSFTVRFRLRVR